MSKLVGLEISCFDSLPWTLIGGIVPETVL